MSPRPGRAPVGKDQSKTPRTVATRIGRAVVALAVTLPFAASPLVAHGIATGLKSWPQSRFDAAHTGYDSAETVLNRSNVSRLKVEWKFQAGHDIEATPVEAGGLTFVATSAGRLYALSSRSGRLVWSASTGFRNPSTAAVAGGRVFVSGASATRAQRAGIVALDAKTGRRLWRLTLLGREDMAPAGRWSTDPCCDSSPTVTAGSVYQSDATHVYAIDAAGGRVRWTRQFAHSNGSCESQDNQKTLVAGSPSATGTSVYFMVNSHRRRDESATVHAVDAATGKDRWTEIEPQAFAYTAPVLSSGKLLLSFDSYGSWEVRALDALAGEPLWQRGDLGEISVSPAVAPDAVYFVGDLLYGDALWTRNGRKRWEVDYSLLLCESSSSRTLASFSSPAAAGGVLYYGVDAAPAGDCGLIAFSARTGKVLYSYAMAGGTLSGPSVAGGMVYMGSNAGNFYAFGIPLDK
jgi:outer membrane protein assembly factor BamB